MAKKPELVTAASPVKEGDEVRNKLNGKKYRVLRVTTRHAVCRELGQEAGEFRMNFTVLEKL